MVQGDFTLFPAVAVAIAWSVITWRRGEGWWTWAIGVVVIAHLSAVVSFTLLPLPVQPEVIAQGREFQTAHNNVVPLASVVNAIVTGNYPSVVSQSIGNLLLLAPFGFCGPLLWPRLRSWRVMLLAGLAVSLTVELLQLGISMFLGYTYKIADIDDLIFNTAGVMLGYLVFCVADRWLDLERPSKSSDAHVAKQ